MDSTVETTLGSPYDLNSLSMGRQFGAGTVSMDWGGMLTKGVKAGLAFGLALALVACATPPAANRGDVAGAETAVRRAAADIQTVAWRARTFYDANNRERAAREVEEAEVILRKARNARRRVREAHDAAVARLEAARDEALVRLFDASSEYDPDSFSDPEQGEAAAARRVERLGGILATTDREIATIEQTVAALKKLDITPRR